MDGLVTGVHFLFEVFASCPVSGLRYGGRRQENLAEFLLYTAFGDVDVDESRCASRDWDRAWQGLMSVECRRG